MVTLTVNGHTHQVDVDPETPLLYVLRGELGLNGAKFGCGVGQCCSRLSSLRRTGRAAQHEAFDAV